MPVQSKTRRGDFGFARPPQTNFFPGFCSTDQDAVVIIALARGAIMVQETKPNEDPKKKRVIEFDMFVRDLEPSEEEKVRGGGGSPENPSEKKDATK